MMMTSKTYDGEFKLACVNTSTWQRRLVDIYSHRRVPSPHVYGLTQHQQAARPGDDSNAASGTTTHPTYVKTEQHTRV